MQSRTQSRSVNAYWVKTCEGLVSLRQFTDHLILVTSGTHCMVIVQKHIRACLYDPGQVGRETRPDGMVVFTWAKYTTTLPNLSRQYCAQRHVISGIFLGAISNG